MTPEQAQTHLMMLKMGQFEAYDRELDRLLIEQEPLSPLVLELAFCMSDRRETISVLHNYLLDHPADQAAIFNPLMARLRECCRAGTMAPAEIAAHLWELAVVNDYRQPWDKLLDYLPEYELWDEGLISEAVFERCFKSHFLDGVKLDPWSLQHMEHRKRGLLERLRDWMTP